MSRGLLEEHMTAALSFVASGQRCFVCCATEAWASCFEDEIKHRASLAGFAVDVRRVPGAGATATVTLELTRQRPALVCARCGGAASTRPVLFLKDGGPQCLSCWTAGLPEPGRR